MEEMVTFLDLSYVYLGDKHTQVSVRVLMFVGLGFGCISQRRCPARREVTHFSAAIEINLKTLCGGTGTACRRV